MPHLTIQHSPALGKRYDMAALCEALRAVMAREGCFPLGGIRVRALPTPSQAIADADPRNCFADLVLRMGAGRDLATKQAAGVSIMSAAKAFFADELETPHFALSLEIVEIDAELSWKTNTIHARLKGQS